MTSENSRLALVAAAVALVLVIPILGRSFGGPPTTVTDVMSGTKPVDVSKTQDTARRIAKATDTLDGARIVGADSEPQNWLAHGRTYSGQRFSPLSKINAGNAKELGLAWSYDTNTIRGLEASPIVVNGVMFATGSWSHVYALDAKTGEELWTYDPEVPGEWGRKPCCDVVNRGVAVWKGRVYVAALDGRLICLDAKNGKPIWDITTIDRSKPYAITGAPIVVGGKVIIGNGGAEFGVRGYITAYDAETGRQLWRFYTVPGDPRQPVENPELKQAAPTWKDDPKAPYRHWDVGGGGTVWDAFSYDPDSDLVFFGTGNATAWSRAVRSPGGGDNLFTASIVAVKAATGELAWYFQTTSSDQWDFDATADLVLADLAINGQPRKVVMQANKNGYYYVFDRQTGEFISGNNFVPVTWSTGLDAKGHAKESPSANYSTSKMAFVMPAPAGGHNWQPMSFSPQTGFAYIPAHNSGQPFLSSTQSDIKLGGWNVGVDFNGVAKAAIAAATSGQPAPPREGQLLAWDPVNQKEIWRVKHPTFWNGGVLSTAGNLVFQGLGDGTFNAWSADKGEKLWSIDTHTGIIAPPVTYSVGDEQYVVVLAGWGGAQLSFGPEPTAPVAKYGNAGKIFAFKLGGKQTIDPPQAAEVTLAKPPEQTANAATIATGMAKFHRNCAVCHGFLVMSGGILPDLRHSTPETFDRYKEIVIDGERKASGMASFADLLSEDDVKAIKAYVIEQANLEYKASQAAKPPTEAPKPNP